MRYTHVKRSYKAACLQYDGTNGDQVTAMLEESGATCERKPCGRYILVRWTDGREDDSVHAIGNGWWVRRGENGITKCYPNKTFNERYVEIPDAD